MPLTKVAIKAVKDYNNSIDLIKDQVFRLRGCYRYQLGSDATSGQLKPAVDSICQILVAVLTEIENQLNFQAGYITAVPDEIKAMLQQLDGILRGHYNTLRHNQGSLIKIGAQLESKDYMFVRAEDFTTAMDSIIETVELLVAILSAK